MSIYRISDGTWHSVTVHIRKRRVSQSYIIHVQNYFLHRSLSALYDKLSPHYLDQFTSGTTRTDSKFGQTWRHGHTFSSSVYASQLRYEITLSSYQFGLLDEKKPKPPCVSEQCCWDYQRMHNVMVSHFRWSSRISHGKSRITVLIQFFDQMSSVSVW